METKFFFRLGNLFIHRMYRICPKLRERFLNNIVFVYTVMVLAMYLKSKFITALSFCLS